jgi:hypothetical protein
MDDKKNKLYLKIEKMLIIIGILLVVTLIALKLLDMEFGTIDREYNFDAYKVTTTDNSVTTTVYYADGGRIKFVETYCFENGKVTKIVDEYYDSTVHMTRYWYNRYIEQLEEDKKNGQPEQPYTISRKGNALIYTYNDINFEPIPTASEEEKENYNIYLSFTTNEQIINYFLEHLDEQYAENYTKVY